MGYSFDIEHAKTYGLEEAIMIHNFQHWINKNKANNKHQHDGKTWTYNTIPAFCELFPFWSYKQIRRILNSLITQNIIIEGNHNQQKYDRTTWYAFVDEDKFLISNNRPNGRMEAPKQADGCAQTGAPIPDKKTTDLKPDKTTTPARRPSSSLSESEIATQAQQLSEKLRGTPLRPVSLSLIKKLILDTAADHVQTTALWIIQQYGECHIRNPSGLLHDMVMNGMDKPLEAVHQDLERVREQETKDYLERMRHERSKPKELGDDIKQFTASL